MNLPRRRRSRARGAARLTAVNDVQAAGRWLSQLQTDPADGATAPLAALRGEPRYTPPGNRAFMPPPGDRTPAAILPMPQARGVMTVYPPGPGVPAPTPHGVRAAVYIET